MRTNVGSSSSGTVQALFLKHTYYSSHEEKVSRLRDMFGPLSSIKAVPCRLVVLSVASQHVTTDVIGPLSSIKAKPLEIGVLPIIPQRGFRDLSIA